MAEIRCIVCNALHTENDCYPCCSRACENEVYDRGFEAFSDEQETLNITNYRDYLDYAENNPVKVIPAGACTGYGQMCMCEQCMRKWVDARQSEYGV